MNQNLLATRFVPFFTNYMQKTPFSINWGQKLNPLTHGMCVGWMDKCPAMETNVGRNLLMHV